MALNARVVTAGTKECVVLTATFPPASPHDAFCRASVFAAADLGQLICTRPVDHSGPHVAHRWYPGIYTENPVIAIASVDRDDWP